MDKHSYRSQILVVLFLLIQLLTLFNDQHMMIWLRLEGGMNPNSLEESRAIWLLIKVRWRDILLGYSGHVTFNSREKSDIHRYLIRTFWVDLNNGCLNLLIPDPIRYLIIQWCINYLKYPNSTNKTTPILIL